MSYQLHSLQILMFHGTGWAPGALISILSPFPHVPPAPGAQPLPTACRPCSINEPLLSLLCSPPTAGSSSMSANTMLSPSLHKPTPSSHLLSSFFFFTARYSQSAGHVSHPSLSPSCPDQIIQPFFSPHSHPCFQTNLTKLHRLSTSVLTKKITTSDKHRQ